jgi:hypothetical protein
MAGLDLTAVKTYLGDIARGWSDDEIAQGLLSETAAQAAVVKAGDLTRPDVVEALHRRVAHNLATRALPLGVQQNDSAFNTVSSNDPEVRRLERPYRKVFVG